MNLDTLIIRALSYTITLIALITTPLSLSQPAAAQQKNASSQKLKDAGVEALINKQYEDAIALLKEAAQQDPKDSSLPYNLATAYLLSHNPLEAERTLTAALEIFPNDAPLHARLGDTYFGQKKLLQAKKYFQRAVAIAPEQATYTLQLITTLTLLKEKTAAKKLIDALSQRSTPSPQMDATLSALYLSHGDSSQGLYFAERSVKTTPSIQGYLNLGSAHEIKGNVREALSAFEQAQRLGETSQELSYKIKALRNVLSSAPLT